MGQPTLGMNPDEVERLGQELQRVAGRFGGWVAEIDRVVARTAWTGRDAAQFKGTWWPQHRRRLQTIAGSMHDFGKVATHNAQEQRRVSSTSGVFAGARAPGIGGGPGGSHSPYPNAGGILEQVDEAVVPLASIVSQAASIKGLSALKQGSNTFAAFSALNGGVSIGENLAQGNYADSALDATQTGGEIAAFAMKRAGGPVGYLGGVATQSWVEVVRAGREIDWSPQGLQAIQQASWSDWGNAFKEVPGKLVNPLLRMFS